MCGIVGFVGKNTLKEKREIIKKMGDRIIHRGPDGEGYFVNSKVALGHRRLSIIDIDGGSQPLKSADGSLVIVFNGEIYNYLELKEELIKDGYVFSTKTDTEVILYGYQKWGYEVVKHLRGMFAFVIYDKPKDLLFGGRDAFGIKPLYYYHKDNKFFFASEIKAFLEHKDFQKEINTDPLKMYLIFQYSVKEETFFKNVYKLKPGHYFIYQNNNLAIKKYFEVSFSKSKLSYPKIKARLDKQITESINIHKVTSDVLVGSYLSSGVDSSLVVKKSLPSKTFTVGFNYQGFDECGYAKELSQKLNLENYSQKINPDDFFKYLPTIMYHTDEPHANLSTVPLYFLSNLTFKYVKVVLSGEGADEMFGGYNEYMESNLEKIYLSIPFSIRKIIRNIVKKLPKFKGKNTLLKLGLPFNERYVGHGTFMEEEEANKILAPSLQTDETIASLLQPYYDKVKNESEFMKKRYLDFYFWLPQDILLKADKMSMAHSIELRTPLLDTKLFELAREIPQKYLIKEKKTKYIFREVAKEYLEDDISKRRKCGFPVPFSKWLLEKKYYNLVKKAFEKDFVSNFFNQEYILDLLDKHYTKQSNNGRIIYNIYCFIIWYQVYFD